MSEKHGKYIYTKINLPKGGDYDDWLYHITNTSTGNTFDYRVTVSGSASASTDLPPDVQATVNTQGDKLVNTWLDQGLEEKRQVRVTTSGIESRKLDKKAHKHSGSPIFSEEIKNRIKESHFEVSALSIGMKLELDAMNFYRSCAQKAQNEEVKQFFTELADWETDHYRAFEQQLEMLKEEYFQANNFIPM